MMMDYIRRRAHKLGELWTNEGRLDSKEQIFDLYLEDITRNVRLVRFYQCQRQIFVINKTFVFYREEASERVIQPKLTLVSTYKNSL